MPGKILGIDIKDDYISAVLVTSGLKGDQVTSCAWSGIEQDNGIEGALQNISREIDLKSDNCFVSIPGKHISFRNLQMPFKDHKKINQTLPFEIETVVPFALEDIIIDFNVIESSEQSELLAVYSEKAYISRYLDILKTLEIEPGIIDIYPVPIVLRLLSREDTPENGLFLDIGFNRNTMVLFLNNRINLIRNFDFDGGGISFPGFEEHMEKGGGDNPDDRELGARLEVFCESVRKTIHSFSAQNKKDVDFEKVFFSGPGMLYPGTGDKLSDFFERPVQEINISRDKDIDMDFSMAQSWNPALMDGALALAVRYNRRGQGFNFRKGEFELKKSYLGPINEMKRAGLLLALLLIFVFINLGVDYYFLSKTHEAGERRITNLFRQVFPETAKVLFPVLQMKQKLEELESSSGILPTGVGENRTINILKDISRRIPGSMDIDVSNMVIDGEAVRISGDTDTFSTVDDLKNNLEPSEYFKSVTLGTANLDRTGKRVNFEITMQRAE